MARGGQGQRLHMRVGGAPGPRRPTAARRAQSRTRPPRGRPPAGPPLLAHREQSRGKLVRFWGGLVDGQREAAGAAAGPCWAAARLAQHGGRPRAAREAEQEGGPAGRVVVRGLEAARVEAAKHGAALRPAEHHAGALEVAPARRCMSGGPAGRGDGRPRAGGARRTCGGTPARSSRPPRLGRRAPAHRLSAQQHRRAPNGRRSAAGGWSGEARTAEGRVAQHVHREGQLAGRHQRQGRCRGRRGLPAAKQALEEAARWRQTATAAACKPQRLASSRWTRSRSLYTGSVASKTETHRSCVSSRMCAPRGPYVALPSTRGCWLCAGAGQHCHASRQGGCGRCPASQ